MPEVTPTAVAPEASPAAPAAPVKVVPEPVQKTREQLAVEALGTVPDAPDPYGEDPVAADEPAETVDTAPEEPAPAPVVKDFALIAAERRARAQARRAPPAPPASIQNDAMVEALRLITERLAPKPVEITPEMELSLDALVRQTGKSRREIYQLFTDQYGGKAGALKVPVAPPSAESKALAEMRAQFEAQQAELKALKDNISAAGEEWQEQQRQAEIQANHTQLASQFVGYVETNKTKFPFTAAADPAEVGEALARATANLKSPLTADQLVGRLEARLKADYERLAKAVPARGGTAAPTNPQRTVAPQQPPVPPQRVVSQAKKPFVIPPELHGIRGVNSASEASRLKAAMDLLKEVPDED